MPRSRVRGSLVRSSRRQTSWGAGPKSETNGAVAPTISASSQAVGAVAASPASDGLTLIRLRGEFLFRLVTATAVGDGYFGAVAMGIFTDAALTIGITALQTPITDETWDGWMWHQYFTCVAQGQISAAGVSLSAGQQDATTAAVRIEVDSKAMRKIPVGMSLAVVLEVTQDATATALWNFNTRSLTKLP